MAHQNQDQDGVRLEENLQPNSIPTKLPLGVTTDEENDDTVRVCLVFPGLKKKLCFAEAANADISIDIKEQSFDVSLVMKEKKNKKMISQPYKYAVKKLPDKIIPEKCSHKVRDGLLIIKLHKANARSWLKELSDVGLETHEDIFEKPEGDN